MNQARFHRVIRAVSEKFGVAPEHILSKDRHHPIVFARFASMWLCRNLEVPAPSYPLIARCHGRTDHTQVMYACDWINRKMLNDPWYAHTMRALKDHLTKTLHIPDSYLLVAADELPQTFVFGEDAIEV